MLPADHEVERWARVESATLVLKETALYKLIDGAAPKYIERGWQGGSYTSYGQDSSVLQVAIHDMGTAANAESIFAYDLPVSHEAIRGRPNTAVDLGMPTAYRSMATVARYYIEVSIDAHSDAARASIEAFTLRILGPGGA
jgi:hypothetical protein